jgi:chromosomal replication initiation ATPase DnaA
MFVAQYRRTEASAKPKFREPQVQPKPSQGVIISQEALERKRQELERIRAIDAERQKVQADIDAANAALLAFNGKSRGVTKFSTIMLRICRALDIRKDELLSNRRNREVVMARHAIMYWACRLTRMSLPEIGRRLGGRDHTTILHGRDTYPIKRQRMGRTLRPVK